MTSSPPRAAISTGRRSTRSKTASWSIFAKISGVCRSSGWCRAGACSTSTRRSGRSRSGPTPCATRRICGAAALTGSDTLAAAALDRLCLIFGASAGDFALAQGAHAVVLAGGLGLPAGRLPPPFGFPRPLHRQGTLRADDGRNAGQGDHPPAARPVRCSCRIRKRTSIIRPGELGEHALRPPRYCWLSPPGVSRSQPACCCTSPCSGWAGKCISCSPACRWRRHDYRHGAHRRGVGCRGLRPVAA